MKDRIVNFKSFKLKLRVNLRNRFNLSAVSKITLEKSTKISKKDRTNLNKCTGITNTCKRRRKTEILLTILRQEKN